MNREFHSISIRSRYILRSLSDLSLYVDNTKFNKIQSAGSKVIFFRISMESSVSSSSFECKWPANSEATGDLFSWPFTVASPVGRWQPIANGYLCSGSNKQILSYRVHYCKLSMMKFIGIIFVFSAKMSSQMKNDNYVIEDIDDGIFVIHIIGKREAAHSFLIGVFIVYGVLLYHSPHPVT